MRFRQRTFPFLILATISLGCPPRAKMTPPPADAPAEQVAVAGATVFIGAGDIARCDGTGDEGTARLVDSVLKADSVAGVNDAVFTVGDNAYPVGSPSDFANCFGPSWGDTAKRIMKKIHPAPGNHEHKTPDAAPYYAYFGEKRAGSPRKGYYSYDLGDWHVIVLNSEIVVNGVFPVEDRRAQEEWLRKDLAGSNKKCAIAYLHHPRFSSGWHGNEVLLQPLWQIMYDGNVDVVIHGHDHNYERFAPLTAAGVLDTLRGIVSFVVGTGGAELRGLAGTPQVHSLSRIQGYYGVLKLTLGKEEYRHAFLTTDGRIWDPGGGKCH